MLVAGTTTPRMLSESRGTLGPGSFDRAFGAGSLSTSRRQSRPSARGVVSTPRAVCRRCSRGPTTAAGAAATILFRRSMVSATVDPPETHYARRHEMSTASSDPAASSASRTMEPLNIDELDSLSSPRARRTTVTGEEGGSPTEVRERTRRRRSISRSRRASDSVATSI